MPILELYAMRWRRATPSSNSLPRRPPRTPSVTTRDRWSHWYRGHVVRGSHALKAGLLGVCGAVVGALAAGCGESRHQDASEPRGRFTVQVTHAAFPAHQVVARTARMVLDVRNAGTRTLPNVTVAVQSFYYLSDYPGLASRRRPIWVVDDGPGRIPNPPVETVQVDPQGSGTTANYDVWALGPLPAGATRSFVWRGSPVKPGVHTIAYRVYAGLNGKARARLAGGAPPTGTFTVDVAGRPPMTHVNPVTGKVEPGPYVPSEA
jgi:hypothetical protein